MANCNIFVVLN